MIKNIYGSAWVTTYCVGNEMCLFPSLSFCVALIRPQSIAVMSAVLIVVFGRYHVVRSVASKADEEGKVRYNRFSHSLNILFINMQ